ncbi:hypothetical protein [Sphingobacterium tabacisoli]|uniref:Uncharacterized protein n=1 Tax=Sphingobacterium tabacisoli TaxID=2044855 RepID=A0ABW5L7X0_9SPHI|nr:hypothetical protein [Sphingobacterium tabacisoli]
MGQNKQLKIKRVILKIYGFLSVLFVTDLIAYFGFEISLRGYFADIILFWFWCFGSFLIVVIFWKTRLAKLFLIGMVSFVLLSMLPMGLPFYALALSTTPFGLRLSKDLNSSYRGQIVSYSVMVPPWLEVMEKRGVVERRVLQCKDRELLDDRSDVKIRYARDISFDSETDTTMTLTLFYIGIEKTFVFDKRTGAIQANLYKIDD